MNQRHILSSAVLYDTKDEFEYKFSSTLRLDGFFQMQEMETRNAHNYFAGRTQRLWSDDVND